MDNLEFDPHALDEMARDNIPVDAVHHVVGDTDLVIDRDDGITEYTGAWQGMTIVVVARDDYVITAWEDKRRRRWSRR